MTAITKPRNTPQMQGYPLPSSLKFPVAADEVLYQGTLCMIKDGYLYDGAATTGAQGVGMVDPNAPSVDNTGGDDGDIDVAVIPGCFRWANSGGPDLIAQDDVGQLCYIVDNQTVALTDGSATRSIAGTIVAVDAAGVWVYSNFAAPVDATALAAAIASIGQITTDLASNANGKGASLVGIEDAGTYTAQTEVEGALQELYLKTFGFGIAPQALSGAGAVDPTKLVTLFTSTGAAQALSLADGTKTGQLKLIIHTVDGGSGVLTPTTAGNLATVTLTNRWEWALLQWSGAAWNVVAASPVAVVA